MAAQGDPGAGRLRGIRLPDLLPEPISHYCDAVEAGGWLYVSGMLALAPDGALVGKGDAQAQSRRILSTLRQLLERLDASLADVAKVTVYLVDMRDRAAVNLERVAAFKEWRPASTLVEVSKLAHPDALVEIECVARLRASG